jgi:hypothetical protein
MKMFKGNSAYKFSQKFWFTALISPESYTYLKYFIPVNLLTTFYFSSNPTPTAIGSC